MIIKVTVKGGAPSEGWVSISKRIVTRYSLKIGDYVINYDSSKSNEQEVIKNGTILIPPSAPIEGGTNSEDCFLATIIAYLCDNKNVLISETIKSREIINASFNKKKCIKSMQLFEAIEASTTCNDFESNLPDFESIKQILEYSPFLFVMLDLELSDVGNENLTVTKIGKEAFVQRGLTNIKIPGKVVILDRFAFARNQLMKVTIPNGLTTIKEGEFQDNQLTSIEIPHSVTSILNNAFSENKLSSVIIHNTQANVHIVDNAFSDAWAEGYSDSNIEWMG